MLPASGPLSHQAVKIPQQTELVDEDAMSQIRKGHDTMCVVLTSRHKNLDSVRAVWTTGDIKASTCSCPGLRAEPRGPCEGLGGSRLRHGTFTLTSSSASQATVHRAVLHWPSLALIILGAVLLTPHNNPVVIPHSVRGHSVPSPL